MYSLTMKTLAEMVLEARSRLGLTQEQFGKQVGVSHSYIYNLEKGKNQIPSPGVMSSLARVIGMPEEDLLRAVGYLSEREVSESAQLSLIDVSPMDEDIRSALHQIDRLTTEDARLAAFRSLPEGVQRAIRQLAVDFLNQASAAMLAPNGPPVDLTGK